MLQEAGIDVASRHISQGKYFRCGKEIFIWNIQFF